MPVELAEAQLVIGLCDRWHKLPSEVYGEGVELLRLLSMTGLTDGTASSPVAPRVTTEQEELMSLSRIKLGPHKESDG